MFVSVHGWICYQRGLLWMFLGPLGVTSTFAASGVDPQGLGLAASPGVTG